MVPPMAYARHPVTPTAMVARVSRMVAQFRRAHNAPRHSPCLNGFAPTNRMPPRVTADTRRHPLPGPITEIPVSR